jgi:hypothetical protein
LFLLLFCFLFRVGIKGFIFCQPCQCLSGQISKPPQIYDCFALWMCL